MFRLHFREQSPKSSKTATHGVRSRTPRKAKRSMVRHMQFETLEDRYLLTAGPTAVGSEFLINTYTTSAQVAPAIATSAAGDYVAVWSSKGQDGGGYGIYAQRYNPAGAAQGSEFRVNTYTTGDQKDPTVAMDTLGDFVVAWQSDGQDGDGEGIYAQRYNSTGAAQGSEFRVNTATTSDQSAAKAAMDAGGDFVITWVSSGQDGSLQGIYAQRYNAAGTAQGSEFQVNTYTTDIQQTPSVAMDSTGDFVIAWASKVEDSGTYGVYAQRYNAAGAAQGSEFQVNTYTTAAQAAPAVAMDYAGDFVIAWQSYGQDGDNYGIYAQRYSSTGATLGSEFQVNTYTTDSQQNASVSMDSTGDFVVSWTSAVQDPDGSEGIYAQAYTSTGTANGSEFRVNTYTTGDQASPAVAMDQAGNFVVAWKSQDQDGSDLGIYGQRYAGNYTLPPPAGQEFRVNTHTTGVQQLAKTAADAAGDFVVVWESYGQDGDHYGIYAQRYNAAGTAQGSEFRVNTFTTGNQQTPTVAMDSAGDFVVAWESDGQDGANGGIYAQRYDAAGAVQGSEFRVNTYTTGNQSAPSAAMDSAGDFAIAWASAGEDDDGNGVYAQQYNAAGDTQGSQFQVNTYTTGNQQAPTTAMDSTGDFVIAWESDGQDGDGYGVYAQRYNAAGAVQGSEFRVNTFTTDDQRMPAAAMDSAGDFVVTWESYGQDGDHYGIYAQRYNAAGAVQGSEFLVNTYTTGDQSLPTVSMDAAGDFVVSWASYEQDGSLHGVYAQAYNAAGATVGGEFQVNSSTADEQSYPSVAMDGTGDFVIAWQSYGQDGDNYGVYAQRYSGNFGITQTGNTLTINGAGLTQANPAEVVFTSSTGFYILFNGVPHFYDTSTGINKVVYNGVSGKFSEAIFNDTVASDDYTATQALDSTQVTRSGGVTFEFDSNDAQYLYVYSKDPSSTATVSLTTGSGSNFYVDAADSGYSYLADPVALKYSELSGFSTQTVTGSAGTTYAYIYSTTDATVVADPNGSSITVGSATSTLASFPQVYVVGAADGSDKVTLNSEGGGLVVSPSFTSVQGTLSGSDFTLGALDCADVIAQASVAATDTAFVYSYAANTFNGTTTASTLSGSTMNLAGTSYDFSVQAQGYPSITVLESGAGTDIANLNSPGNGTFTSTPTVSTLTVGSVTVFTVNTYAATTVNNSPVNIPVASQILMVGKGDGTDVANLYDGTGTNSLVASGSTATIKLNLGNGSPEQTVAVTDFGKVTGYQTQGDNNTVHKGTIDFIFQTVGNWTSD